MALLRSRLYEETYISLFGRVIPQQLRDRSPSPEFASHRNRAGITSIPVELLMRIFDLHFKHFVIRRKLPSLLHYRFHAGVEGSDTCDCDEEEFVADNHFPLRNTLFPYAHAQVCVEWRQILSAQPKFWTNVVVSRMAGIHTPPAALEEYLKWSRDLTVDVFIGNVGYGGYGHERELIHQYTEILAPHVNRCRVLDYDVRYATSLPCLLRDFDTISQNLLHLQLKSQETHDPSDSWIPTPEDTEKLVHRIDQMNGEEEVIYDRRDSSPRFNKLVLDGRNFILASVYCPSLLTCTTLEVHNYRRSLNRHPEVDYTGFILAQGIHKIQEFNDDRLEWVLFNNIEFGLDSDYAELDDAELGDAEGLIALPDIEFPLRFINVNPSTLEQTFRFPYDEDAMVTIEQCSIPPIDGPLSIPQLHLINIEEEYLTMILQHWIGAYLWIQRCPSLNDHVLKAMERSQRTMSTSDTPSQTLRISECPNFSFDALRRMVTAQDEITDLQVSEAPGPISKDDVDSMSFLETFVYDKVISLSHMNGFTGSGFQTNRLPGTEFNGLVPYPDISVPSFPSFSDDVFATSSKVADPHLHSNFPTQTTSDEVTQLRSDDLRRTSNDTETCLTPYFSTQLQLDGLNLEDYTEVVEDELYHWLSDLETE